MYDTVTATAEQVFIPLTVGGGVRSTDDVARLLASGADKVGVNSAAIARPALIDEILGGAGIATILTDVRVPRLNAIMERWVKSLRGELLDRTLIWNEAHLRHALREYERHYNEHRTHRSLAAAAPLRARQQPLGTDRIERLAVFRRDRLGGVLHEYRHAA